MSHQAHDAEFYLKVLLKAAAGLFVILFCLFVVLPITAVVVRHWKSETAISDAQQEMVTFVIRHGYPNSKMVRADGSVSFWSAGDTITIGILVTFESEDPFDAIKGWYFQHPAGGWGGGFSSGNIFPREGLEKLDENTSGKTRYRVTYVNVMTCGDFLGCNRPLQQVR
jgi:hypothetical protein